MMKFCFKFLECGYFLFLTCLSVWCKDDTLFRLVDYCTCQQQRGSVTHLSVKN